MRLWFIGGGGFAALCLERLVSLLPPGSFEKVITGLPTRAGRRGMKEVPSRVEECALSLGLPCERTGPLSQNAELISLLQNDRNGPPDVIFVIDFARLIREPFLSAPRWGCLNIHPSMLPRWRGAAPVQRALMNGDDMAGVTVFRLVPEMDAGPVLAQASVPVEEETTASELYGTLSRTGAALAADALTRLENSKNSDLLFSEQNPELATYAPRLSKEEFQVEWSWPAKKIHDTVRGLEASGGAFVVLRGGRLKLWRTHVVKVDKAEDSFSAQEPGRVLTLAEEGPVVSCGEDALRLDFVQAESRRRTSGLEWARGLRLGPGDAL